MGRRASKSGIAGTQIAKSELGSVGEGRFYEIMTIRGRGQFVCYPPRSDVEGNDFLVKRRWRKGSLAVLVKTHDSHDAYDNFTQAVDATDLPLTDEKLLVLLDYDVERADLRRFCWVIPDTVYRAQSTLTRGKYESTFSRKPTAVGRWVDYRYGPEELWWVVGWYLDGQKAAPEFRWMAPPRDPRKRAARATPECRSRRGRAPAGRRPASPPRSRRRR